MKFSIITPSFNREKYLRDTISSVLNQKGKFEIEYFIQDGGSEPSTLEILEYFKQFSDSPEFKKDHPNTTFDFNVEPDTGMYSALNKGFEKSTGDIMAWINSDDFYFPGALNTVCEIFSQHPEIEWLVGLPATVNSAGSVTSVDPRQPAISRAFVRDGYYRGDRRFFNWLPQDSIFWRRSLWEKAGPLDESLKLVSDFRLWQSFAKYASPVKVDSMLAAYRSHGDQLTGDPMAYADELGPGRKSSLRKEMIFALAWLMPKLFRSKTNLPLGNTLLRVFGLTRTEITGQVVHWDDGKSEWLISDRSAL